MVQWLGLDAPTAEGMGSVIQSLVGELKSYMLCSVAKKKRKKINKLKKLKL